MQAVKFRIALFYFDMNIFEISDCLAKTLDRSPFLYKRLNDGQPAGILNRRARHVLDGMQRKRTGLFTVPADTM